MTQLRGLPFDHVPLKAYLARNDSGAWGEDPTGDGDTIVLRSTEQSVDGQWRLDAPALRHLSHSDAARTRLEIGDLVVTKTSGSALHIGKTTIVDEPIRELGASFGNFMQRLRARGSAHPRYLWYCLNSELVRTQLDVASTTSTGLSNLNGSLIGSVRVPRHPRDEQRRIADFLDAETAQIDALIAEQERFIALLRERRLGVIEHEIGAADAPRTSLKRMLSGVDQGVSPQADAYLADDAESWGVLKSGCVNNGVFRQTEHKRLADDFEINQRYVVRVGDLIVNRASGSPDLVGSAGLVDRLDYNLILSDKLFRLIPLPSTDVRFLKWALNSVTYREQVLHSISGAEGLANNLPLSALRSFQLPLPEFAEQRRISNYLDRATASIDALIREAEHNIALSKERRASLITAAVTGQIDVTTGRAA